MQLSQLSAMRETDTTWFTEALASKKLSQRGLAKLLGVDPSSVNRLVHGQRAMRLDEAEKLAPLLGVPTVEVIKRAGVKLAEPPVGTTTTHLVGHIDGAGEAHIDWRSRIAIVETLPDLPRTAVAVQYRTAMTSLDAIDGWTVYVEPPVNGRVDQALGRLALVTLESGITIVGFLRRGYTPGTYNVTNFVPPLLENVTVRWATAVLLLRP
ncbi:helix-turn-helix transcriptional regulator [Luteibacter sp.]|uniref:helix-turn-helix domain-containing protein n=1 Tax=Luteibacter sp. TaxID=1886636 RepID=UPI00280872D8|nr:helix-turn-helix transcriptional regulator [Luteibacter sp.]MDQ8050701.1 helix-turn-helix transcriptional regulator [Luteibacter sp.]